MSSESFCSRAASEFKEYISTSTYINSVFSKHIFFLLGFSFVICFFVLFFDLFWSESGGGGGVLFHYTDYRIPA